MRRLLILVFVLAGAVAITLSCRKTEFAFKPTYAFPLVDAELTVADIVGARPSEVELVFENENGGDSLFSYRLVYLDTFPPLTFDSFGGSTTLPDGATFEFPEKRVFLRMTGRSEDGTGKFYFTDPIVEFQFENELETEFLLSFTSLYTENVITEEVRDINIVQSSGYYPASIAAATSGGVIGTSSLVISNETTNDELTQVFTPSPKYLYYKPRLEVVGDGSAQSGDEMRVFSKVILPLEGRGFATFLDTIEYNFTADEAGEVVDYAYLRMNFVNEIPLQASITGTIVDEDYNFIAELPIFDPSTDQVKDEDELVVPGGLTDIDATSTPTSTAQELTTDIRIYTENPVTGKNDVENFADGQFIILKIDFGSTDYDDDQTVKVFSDQRLQVNMGIKTRLGVEGDVDWRDIRDTIQNWGDTAQ